MKSLMITGASGLLGSNLVLEAEGRYNVTAVVHRHPVRFERARVWTADLNDPPTVRDLFSEIHPEWIIHCAADTNLDDLENDPARAALANKIMAAQLAKEAAAMGSCFLHISTDAVFDGRADCYAETDPPRPLNLYAQSKLDGELAVLHEHPGAAVIRMSMFGWSPGRPKSLAEWFHSKLRAGEPCVGLSDIYFSPVYAPTILEIFIRVFEAGLSGLYHLPGDECISKFEFGGRLAEMFGFSRALIESGTSDQMAWVAERPKRTCLNGAKIKQALGIELPSLDQGLARFHADVHRWQG